MSDPLCVIATVVAWATFVFGAVIAAAWVGIIAYLAWCALRSLFNGDASHWVREDGRTFVQVIAVVIALAALVSVGVWGTGQYEKCHPNSWLVRHFYHSERKP